MTIQEAGREILSFDRLPAKFYIFAGTESGVKERYLDSLEKRYGKKSEVDSVEEILTTMTHKQLIPLQPQLYIVRYDESFISQLTEKTAKRIDGLNIIGTIVLLYEEEKHSKKCTKYLPDITVQFDKVHGNFIRKYLKQEFPSMSDLIITEAVNSCGDYRLAKNICTSLSCADNNVLSKFDSKALTKSLGYSNQKSENQIKYGVAARNFNFLIAELESFVGDLNEVFYLILRTLTDIEKCLQSKYSQSDLKDYVKNWTYVDIYQMFMQTYNELKKSRNESSYDLYNGIVYLFGLLQFNPIPAVEVKNSLN
jgi:hypothetical protein